MMDLRWLNRLARKEETTGLTPAERESYRQLLVMVERDYGRQADDARRDQCAYLLGETD